MKMLISSMICCLFLSAGLVCAGPLLSIDLNSCTNIADFICVGQVSVVTNIGVDSIERESNLVNTGCSKTTKLRALINVKHVFKGKQQDKITLECFRNLEAWLPGIAEGTYILFLKESGDIYAPVCQPGFLVPVEWCGSSAKDATMVDILKFTISEKNRRLIRTSLNTLSQLMDSNQYREYLQSLLNEDDTFVQGFAILELVRSGDKSVLEKAAEFAKKNFHDKEVDNLAFEISISIRQANSNM